MTEALYALLAGFLVAIGAYLLMSRHLTRLVAGVIALNQGVNLALLVSGRIRAKAPPFASGEKGTASLDQVSDPLPQALILTAIVITFGFVAFAVIVYRRYHSETGIENVATGEEK